MTSARNARSLVTANKKMVPFSRETEHQIAAPTSGRTSSCTGSPGSRPHDSADRSERKGAHVTLFEDGQSRPSALDRDGLLIEASCGRRARSWRAPRSPASQLAAGPACSSPRSRRSGRDSQEALWLPSSRSRGRGGCSPDLATLRGSRRQRLGSRPGAAIMAVGQSRGYAQEYPIGVDGRGAFEARLTSAHRAPATFWLPHRLLVTGSW